ncbi:MAG: hypothetical protein ABI689_10660 [Thermoanaerobaculia bacterium]
MVLLSSRLGMRSSMFCLALVPMAALGAPIAGESGSSVTLCERLLGEAKQITERNVRSERVGLWERLRRLREVCSAPEVDALSRAKATLIYQILPEYSELGPRVAMLENLEAELETLAAQTTELLEVVDLKVGALS